MGESEGVKLGRSTTVMGRLVTVKVTDVRVGDHKNIRSAVTIMKGQPIVIRQSSTI